LSELIEKKTKKKDMLHKISGKYYNRLTLGIMACIMTFTFSCVKKVDVAQAPQETGIVQAAPLEGVKNSIINISGNNFPTSGVEVRINGKVAQIVSITGNNIQARVPVGAGSGNIEVSFGGAKYNGGFFEYLNSSFMVTSLFSGTPKGNVDGPLATAQFEEMIGIAIQGNKLYTAQYDNPRIRMIDLAAMTASTLAGNGTEGNVDAQGTNARLGKLDFVAPDANGNVYFADQTNNKIRKVDAAGNVTTVATTAFDVQGIKVGKLGNIFVSGPTTIAKYNAAGVLQWRLESKGTGAVDGDTSVASFDLYGNLEVDPTETKIYVSTIDFGTAGFPSAIKMLDLNAKTFTSVEGADEDAGLRFVTDIVRDQSGGLYVSEYTRARIYYIKNGKLTHVLGKAGAGNVDGDQSTAKFAGIHGIAMDAQGNLYIAEYTNNKIRKVVIE
jgi:hypothetical protein